MSIRYKDLTGQKFGRLLVLEYTYTDDRGASRWRCKCDCGNIVTVRGVSLTSGDTRSCGCLKREGNAKTHGKSHSLLYYVYRAIKDRCHNPKNKYWDRYGGRGIKICEEWENDFQSFYDWSMTHGYEKGLSIDRIDNDRDYTPDNCTWSTPKKQANNTSRTVKITFKGITRSIKEWCDFYGKTPGSFQWRKRKGMSNEEILQDFENEKRILEDRKP